MTAPDQGLHETAPLAALNIDVSYGRERALAGVSMLAPAGRLTVLAGPNGSGKSTLLSALSRILKPVSGAVLLDGRAMSDMPTREIARTLGLLPQGPLVPEGITVYDLVCRGRYPHQGFLKQWSAADEEAVGRALSVTGVEALASRPVESLSGGQRQRCFIAMTLAQETAILLFDEPVTFLDLRYQVEVMELIASLSRRHGRTVVAVLHDINAALQYADRIVFLKDGRIHDVLENPADCSEEHIHTVFGAKVTRVTHPLTGKPAFLPSPPTGAAP
ncbi:ABC transporter ATP-binding protein [Rhizobiaceae bacterium BDR2-2]|uniref:ABC transporter ATP-binding protein n=1 Tax=Ectorhizobium quercum TaxID=2965071 RepID=A0AAE3MV77_9HYPH|nr:ABC transporter ATP-binding protein [Ectorhizobium quercum]MCX8995533.1 ABC transporter ATP-binding protein [Ectorhizobium quercum]